MAYYTIVASDLDETLLNDDHEISSENCEAIKEMTRLSVHFVPATGRTLSEIPSLVKDLPEVRYIIHSDGAAVYDKLTGNRIECCMTKETAKKALDIIFDYEISITARLNGICYIDANCNDAENYGYFRVPAEYQEMIFKCATPIDPFKEFCYNTDSFEMFCVHFHSHEELIDCKSRLEAISEIGVARMSYPTLEIFDKNAGKGRALLRLAEHLGIDRAATIGVGDSGNDLNLIELAGLSLATEGACAELKEAADLTICSYKQHTAKYILENFIKNNK